MALLLGFGLALGFCLIKEHLVLGPHHRAMLEAAEKKYQAMKAERDLFQGELISRAARLEERLALR